MKAPSHGTISLTPARNNIFFTPLDYSKYMEKKGRISDYGLYCFAYAFTVAEGGEEVAATEPALRGETADRKRRKYCAAIV